MPSGVLDAEMPWGALDAELSALGGTTSAYLGRPGRPPAHTRAPDRPHYAASTMKVAVLAALYRAADDGTIDPDAPVPVRNDFASARPGGARFGCDPACDSDPIVWARLGGSAPLRWLARRMIVRSSNLAANIVLTHVGLPAVARVWAAVGARHSVTGRGIDDVAARAAGISNVVTARDLAALFAAVGGAGPPVASAAARAAMLAELTAQEHRDDLAAGLPPGTRMAHKSGWVRGVRLAAGLVLPADAPAYVLAVCAGADGGAADDPAAARAWDAEARARLARVSALAWAARHRLSRPPPG